MWTGPDASGAVQPLSLVNVVSVPALPVVSLAKVPPVAYQATLMPSRWSTTDSLMREKFTNRSAPGQPFGVLQSSGQLISDSSAPQKVSPHLSISRQLGQATSSCSSCPAATVFVIPVESGWSVAPPTMDSDSTAGLTLRW